jgi:hypothetical protein
MPGDRLAIAIEDGVATRKSAAPVGALPGRSTMFGVVKTLTRP